MLAKSKRGTGFAGVINYAYEGELDDRKADEKKAEVIEHSDNIRIPRDANDIKGRKRMISDFIRQSQTKETPLKETVGHHIISFNTEDTNKLSNELIKKITSDYIKERGLNNTQYVAIRHHDTEHQHLHIIFNRVDNDGKTLDSNNYFDNSLVGYDLSMKYGLTQPAKQKQYIENIQKKDPNFRENLKNRASAKIKEKSKSTNVLLLKEDELLKKARNLHHLSKLCEAENKSFTKTDDGFVLIDEKKYKQDDLEAVFLLNREEAKTKKDINGTPSIVQKDPKTPDYQIKKQKIEERKTDAAFITDMLDFYLRQKPIWDNKMGKVSLSTLQRKLSENNISLQIKKDEEGKFSGLDFEYNGKSFTDSNVKFRADYIEKLLKRIDYNTRKHIAGVSIEMKQMAGQSQSYFEYNELLLNVSKYQINPKDNLIKDNLGYEWNVRENLFSYAENLKDVYEGNKPKANEINTQVAESTNNSPSGLGEMAGQKASGGVRKLDGEEDEEELRRKKKRRQPKL